MTTPRPPYDRYTLRRGDSPHGTDARGVGRVDLVNGYGLVEGTIREGQGNYVHDKLIERDRIPVYDRDYMVGNADTLVDWTNCGAIRPTLWMRQTTVRRQSGSDATRNYDPHPINRFGTQDQGHGMHTNPQPWKRATNARFGATSQMQPTNVGRLSQARYSGQSFSQTTRMAGS